MQVLNFIINNILTQASIIIALIALLGLVLQKKPVGAVISGTMKTMLGFLVLSAGSAVIVSSLTYFGDIFKAAFGLKGLVASIEGINGQAMNELGWEARSPSPLRESLSSILSLQDLQNSNTYS